MACTSAIAALASSIAFLTSSEVPLQTTLDDYPTPTKEVTVQTTLDDYPTPFSEQTITSAIIE